MKRKTKNTAKSCERCRTGASTLYRVKTDSLAWSLVCKSCYVALVREPGYTYGGTWTNRAR